MGMSESNIFINSIFVFYLVHLIMNCIGLSCDDHCKKTLWRYSIFLNFFKIELTFGEASRDVGMVYTSRNVVSRCVCDYFWRRCDVSAPLLSARTCGQSPCRGIFSTPDRKYLPLAEQMSVETAKPWFSRFLRISKIKLTSSQGRDDMTLSIHVCHARAPVAAHSYMSLDRCLRQLVRWWTCVKTLRWNLVVRVHCPGSDKSDR